MFDNTQSVTTRAGIDIELLASACNRFYLQLWDTSEGHLYVVCEDDTNRLFKTDWKAWKFFIELIEENRQTVSVEDDELKVFKSEYKRIKATANGEKAK